MSGEPAPGAAATDGQAGEAGLRLVAVAVVGLGGGRGQGQPRRAAVPTATRSTGRRAVPTTAAARWWSGPGPGVPRPTCPPPAVSVRSRVHEYGGGAATVAGGVLFYVDQVDQRWYRTAVDGTVRPDRPHPRGAGRRPPPLRRRAADPVGAVAGLGRGAGRQRGATGHRLVAVAVDGSLRWSPWSTSGTSWPPPGPHPTAGGWPGWPGTTRPCPGTAPRSGWPASTRPPTRIRCPGWARGWPAVPGSRWASPVVDQGREPALRRRPQRLVAAPPAGCRSRLAGGREGRGPGRPGCRVPRPRLGGRPVDHGRARRRLPRLPDARQHGRDHWSGCGPGPARAGRTSGSWSLEVVDQPCVSIAGLVVAGGR